MDYKYLAEDLVENEPAVSFPLRRANSPGR